MRRVWRRAAALVTAALIVLSLFAAPAFADYDKDHPEILEEGHLSAVTAILIEAESGDVIFEKDADQPMYPASTTKILTVWLALTLAEKLPGLTAYDRLNTKLTVSENAVNLAPDESSAQLAAGEQVGLIDLCYAAMLPSGNDAAIALAEGLAGTEENYVQLMNQAAYSLGCVNTHFVNANGLHDDGHFTTARDLAVMTRVAMQNETFRQIVLADEYILPKDNIYRARTIKNRNNFVTKSSDESKAERTYPYATGVKTGTTSAAGNCLVASATKEGISLIAVVLGSSSDASRYTDARRLMEYGFAQYVSTSIEEIYLENPRTVEIRGFDLQDPEVGRLKLSLRKVSTDSSDLIVTTRAQKDYWVQNLYSLTVTDFTREFQAPIEQGEVVGTLTYYPERSNPVVFELVASRSIAAREDLAPTIEKIIADAENDPNPFPRITMELVLLYLVAPVLAALVAFKLLKLLFRFIKKRRKVKTYKPTSRYYR